MDFSSSSSLKDSLLGKLVLSSGLLHSSWSKISEMHDQQGPRCKISQEAKYTVVVFAASYIYNYRDSYDSSTLISRSKTQNPFHFLCSEEISSFSLHKPAFQLFASAYNDFLTDLKPKLLQLLKSNKPVIITGAGFGGSLASLITLWLLETIDPTIKLPLCITFGSPLIGDASLQQILKNSVRYSCFLHVADAEQTPITSDFFKPFGMFLICFDSECICIEDPEAVMKLLGGVNVDQVDWRDYGEILQRRDQSSMADSELMIDDVISRMEKRAAMSRMEKRARKLLSDPKLSIIPFVEWCTKMSKKNKIAYYDQFKTHIASLRSHTVVVNGKKELTSYWKSVVAEVEKWPESEISNFPRWLVYSGNSYRRMVEPLDIALYYLSGQKEYRTSGRSHHYVMLDKWCKQGSIEPDNCERSDLSNLLTFDSCFWAEVEEAMIVINLLKTHEGMRDDEREALTVKLMSFEEYVWGMIVKREVSSEIFLEKSSFMRWWKEYKEIKGRDEFSHFTKFMSSGMYESYGQNTGMYESYGQNTEIDIVSSFYKYLGNCLLPLNLSECSGEHVIDFLRKRQGLGDEKAIVGCLSAACEAVGIKENNPFRSVAVTRYLKEGTQKECILVLSWDDNGDVDETLFIESILKELHQREVTPLTYNLSGKENPDSEMLYRSSVGIMVLSNSTIRDSKSFDHLVAIIEFWKAKDLVIIPVYFKVILSDFCRWEDRYEAMIWLFIKYAQADRVQKWKAAITEMASIDGHQWTESTQFMLAQEVVRNACSRLHSNNSKNLDRIFSLLNHSQPLDAEIVGIWGMAGIGKTTIAREIFEILAPQYDFYYFLPDFYLNFELKGLRQMRDDFYSCVFGEEKLSISACDIKLSFMRDWFHKKTILVVLDDVSNAREAEAVVGGFGWFSHGHRIILTSRRKQVLVQCKVKEPYEIRKLHKFESFRLCKQNLNGESDVISELISCSSGIPLALKVLGSSISKQHKNSMMEHLRRLRRNPPTQIQEAFQRSFDGLDENEKNIFLDLACFFRGENRDHVVELLDACGFLTYLGICDLIDESLISVVDNRIEMPIPFQDMGRFIVNVEDEDPCERSRLWDSTDIVDVLTNNSGTDAIEGIFLDTSDLTCKLSPFTFAKMYRLRLLKFYCSSRNQCKLSLSRGLDTLPDELRLLHWENYCLEYLPQKFNPENLVEIHMPYSNMKKLWEGKKNLEKLKKINLSHSEELNDIQMLSGALNLVHIDLKGCTSLVDVSTSIPLSGKLVSLNMNYCFHLRNLPAMADLTSLKLLNLSSCLKLDEIQDLAPNLKELYLAETAIRELPLSVENLTELVTLDLENCRRLHQLPFGISNSRSIVELKLSGCTSLESLPKLKALDVRTSKFDEGSSI